MRDTKVDGITDEIILQQYLRTLYNGILHHSTGDNQLAQLYHETGMSETHSATTPLLYMQHLQVTYKAHTSHTDWPQKVMEGARHQGRDQKTPLASRVAVTDTRTDVQGRHRQMKNHPLRKHSNSPTTTGQVG
jgi:hypothetical protein